MAYGPDGRAAPRLGRSRDRHRGPGPGGHHQHQRLVRHRVPAQRQGRSTCTTSAPPTAPRSSSGPATTATSSSGSSSTPAAATTSCARGTAASSSSCPTPPTARSWCRTPTTAPPASTSPCATPTAATCKFLNRHSGKALDVWEWSTADGGIIAQFADLNGWNQHWQLVAGRLRRRRRRRRRRPQTGLVGWATQGGGTTGGGSAATTTVTSSSALSSAVSGTTARVVRVSGTISCSGMITVGSNKTILGNSGATIAGCGLNVSNASNVIIRNISFRDWNDDAINVQYSTRVWIDHNSFTNGYDGAVDVKRASDYVTVSWNRVYGHDKSMLLGHSDDNAGEDRGHLRVTYHHNWFDGSGTAAPAGALRQPGARVQQLLPAATTTASRPPWAPAFSSRATTSRASTSRPWSATPTPPTARSCSATTLHRLRDPGERWRLRGQHPVLLHPGQRQRLGQRQRWRGRGPDHRLIANPVAGGPARTHPPRSPSTDRSSDHARTLTSPGDTAKDHDGPAYQ